ncbi:MAG: single-stranded-DNA-specific exonuclease RecJ [Gammaproteobacteria bacterium]|nr:single-stranded-DNA-specific exonuclease RecJ [Gammaproteobacteria bacterium]
MKIIRRQHQINSHELPESLHPVLQTIYLNRGITSSEELDLTLQKLHHSHQLSGIERAVEILLDVLQHQRRILVVGDFDADGATSCALSVRALRAMGACDVDYLVPNRFHFGYGLSPQLVEVARERHPDLIITVDNGISSIEGVAAAKACGIAVIVTDHHLQGDSLPEADAIVNPNLDGDEFPSKNLAGVGVVFYLMAALRTALRQQEWFEQKQINEPNMADYLDLVALGTVADVVPLDQNNRILVENGLRRIRAGRCCAGITALIGISKRTANRLVATDLGFALGPRLNAAGRLKDMSLGIECLLTDDAAVAMQMADELNSLNLQRREIEEQMKQQAVAMLDAIDLDDEQLLPAGLTLFDSAWHQGVIGILAARIRERCHRPVIAFAADTADDLKGSARSIPGVHIRDVLDAIATRNPGLITKFGGHAMAAGLSLPRGNLRYFQQAFDEEVRRLVDAEQLQGSFESDGELSSAELNLELAQAIRQGGPWGQHFPEPQFDGYFRVKNHKVVAQRHLKLMLTPENASTPVIEAIAFNQAEGADYARGDLVEIAYRLDINDYYGEERLQLVVQHVQ